MYYRTFFNSLHRTFPFVAFLLIDEPECIHMCHVNLYNLAKAKVKVFLWCTVVIMIHLNLEEFLSCDLIRLVQQNPHLHQIFHM
jgi:hypothetical protein